MILTTKTKVALAAILGRAVVGARALAGKSAETVVWRRGLKWNLDLDEGIDFAIYLLGAFEPSTSATLRSLIHPGDLVFDIGANIGAHTLEIARAVGPSGRVFAFEPTDFAFAKLLRNISLNRELKARICPLQLFLGATRTAPVPETVYSSWPLTSNKPVHPKHRGRLESTEHASMDTVDDFVQRQDLARLDLIKIDVDGNELPVLRGALRTLERFRPTLVMEISPYVHAEQNNSFTEFIDLLRSMKYSMVDSDRNTPVPLDAAELSVLIPDGASINVVARAERETKS